jgi:flagellar motor switch protein FliM
VTAAFPQAVPLARGRNEIADLAVLEPLAAKLARGIQAILDSRTTGEMHVKSGSANAARYPEWRIMQNPFGLLLRFGIASGNDELLMHIPGHLVGQIVDLHYGGDGNLPARAEFTAAELRLTERLASRFEKLFTETLAATGLAPWRFVEMQTDILYAHWPKSRDAIAVQSFTCEGSAIKPSVISLILAVETARAISRRSRGNATENPPIDAVWTDRMRAAAMRIRLPARTILAHSDISFQRLLTLAPGDILPLLLPTQIPLTVAGHVFAHGSLGEANGRTALLIEKMEKEMDQ